MRAGWKCALAVVIALCVVGTSATRAKAADPSAVAPSRVLRARVEPGSEEAATVVFLTRIVNRGNTPLVSPRIHMHAPIELPHQTISELEVDGRAERLKDRWGSLVLAYRLEELGPQATMAGRWAAWVTIRRFRWDLRESPKAPEPSSPSVAALSAEERKLYLRDAEPFSLTDPTVRTAAEQAAAGRSGDAAVLEGVFRLVMERLTYDRDGKWQPVPKVLASGKGSCSEFTYAFVALCRSRGIPARYVGGIVGRSGEPFHLDKVFHRFPQALVPGIGWVDFDPTRTDRARNKRLYFGRTPGPMLLTCVGDGAEGSLTGWDYLESHGWKGQRSQAAAIRMAWWFPPPSPEVRKRVADFRQGLAATSGEKRAALVERALAIGHPYVLPWLDDLLYEPATRVAAARACLKIGGKGELAAVVNCLGRLTDEAGDRAIGQLLDETGGQKLGSDRRKWEEWLKAQTPRTPLPGDDPEKKP